MRMAKLVVNEYDVTTFPHDLMRSWQSKPQLFGGKSIWAREGRIASIVLFQPMVHAWPHHQITTVVAAYVA